MLTAFLSNISAIKGELLPIVVRKQFSTKKSVVPGGLLEHLPQEQEVARDGSRYKHTMEVAKTEIIQMQVWVSRILGSRLLSVC